MRLENQLSSLELAGNHDFFAETVTFGFSALKVFKILYSFEP